MTVADLVKLLSTLPQDAVVVQSRDSEGNDFSPLSEASVERYVAITKWRGELIEGGEDGVPAVVLWPTN